MQSYEKIAKSYKTQSVQTASPGKLVLMLFDGYLRFTAAATKAFDEPDFAKRNEGINNNLIRAQNIVTELQSSLDMSVPGDLPGTLYRLYDYCLNNLQQANLKKDREPIGHSDKVINELREAWAEMLAQNPDGDQPPNPPGQSGSFSLQA
jgi:flagellar protein FliS